MKTVETVTEGFKEIPGFDGRYLMSKTALLFDNKNERFINPHFCGIPRRNYHQATLYHNGNKFTKRIHALMAMTFLNHVYGVDSNLCCDHIDNDPWNNNLENLQIITVAENNRKDKK